MYRIIYIAAQYQLILVKLSMRRAVAVRYEIIKIQLRNITSRIYHLLLFNVVCNQRNRSEIRNHKNISNTWLVLNLP